MAVAPRPSATVVLVRPGKGDGASWETYLLRRSAQSPVLADMWVFPGGTVREDDRTLSGAAIRSTFGAEAAHAALSRPPDSPAETPRESLAYFVAAARELIEEAGVVLTESPNRWPPRDAGLQAEFAAQRQQLESGAPLQTLTEATGAVLALEQLTYYARWITPEALPQRFDARFFVARLPAGQEASPSPYEMADGLWIGASEALERARAGTLSLHFATLNHLRRLAPYRDVEELFAFASSKAVVPVMPSTREKDGRLIPFLPPEIEGVW
jgi:8-oxo-dGTP pyrophosphatase MutT (NUDIX family)